MGEQAGADDGSEQGLADVLRRLRVATEVPVSQPPLPATDAPVVLHAVLGSLAIGGAERIVLDWAARNRGRHPIRLFVIHRQTPEWPVPAGVEIIRPLPGQTITSALQAFGARAVADWRAAVGAGAPVVLCHMTRRLPRDALDAAGAWAVGGRHRVWTRRWRGLS